MQGLSEEFVGQTQGVESLAALAGHVLCVMKYFVYRAKGVAKRPNSLPIQRV